MERLNFTCTAPCGLLSWTINGKSIVPVSDYYGPAILDTHVVKWCTKTDGCNSKHVVLCSEAHRGGNLISTLFIRPLEDLYIQCKSSLIIGSKISTVFSRAIRITVRKNVTPGKHLLILMC